MPDYFGMWQRAAGRTPDTEWRTPSQCTSSGCVEVAVLANGARYVRDTHGNVCRYTEKEWTAFTEAVRNYEF